MNPSINEGCVSDELARRAIDVLNNVDVTPRDFAVIYDVSSIHIFTCSDFKQQSRLIAAANRGLAKLYS